MVDTFALKSDGTLWAWGDNYYGDLGLGDLTYDVYSVPTQVGSGSDWAAISAGYDYDTFARKCDGTLWAWGVNEMGDLGLGDIVNGVVYSVPTQVGSGSDWAAVSADFETPSPSRATAPSGPGVSTITGTSAWATPPVATSTGCRPRSTRPASCHGWSAPTTFGAGPEECAGTREYAVTQTPYSSLRTMGLTNGGPNSRMMSRRQGVGGVVQRPTEGRLSLERHVLKTCVP